MNKLRLKNFATALLSGVLFLNCAISPVGVQTKSRNSTGGEDLETVFDPIVAEQMAKLHIPGAVVVVVKEGRILFTKGYGYADIDKKTPIVPDKTIFRIGSITKVFTATAVMQMADRQKIKLDDDVNKYLKDFKIPATYPQPITFANLLTHTSGLDEISPGRRTADAGKVVPLGEFLKTRLVRIEPPGEVIRYTTYNAALAGFAVEQLTKTPFKEYLQRNIFEPLKMNRSSITAVKKEYAQDLATGYEYDGKDYQKLPFQWFHTYPASDINSTATDMARYMIAQLQGGVIDGQRILSERATREMQATHFRNHPRVSGWAYGFYESTQNGVRFIEHGGTMDDGYSAGLTLVPEQNLGLFIACNTEAGGADLGSAVKNAIFNIYFPAHAKPENITKGEASPASLQRFAAKYRPNIYCHSCSPGPGVFIPDPFEVTVNADGTLSLHDAKWRQIEPLLFELATGQRAGQRFLAFRENSRGEVVYMFQETYRVYEKVAR